MRIVTAARPPSSGVTQGQACCAIRARPVRTEVRCKTPLLRQRKHCAFQVHAAKVQTLPSSEGEEELEEEHVDFKQGGWLWTNDATAKTQAKLKSNNVRPKKSLGQNFVTDDDILRRVVNAARILPGDLVLEVGPGTGNLTRHLLSAGAIVTAVEKDHRLVDQLQAEFEESPGFRLLQGDILRSNVDEILEAVWEGSPEAERDGKKLKVVANLPYYITTDVLKMMLPRGDSFSNLIFMLQEEVAQRFAMHKPGDRDYRYMSVFCKFYSNPVYKFKISREVYFPKPKCDGAVVDFVLTPPSERVAVSSEKKFLSLVHASFMNRRKMMKNSLSMLPNVVVEECLQQAGLDANSRAQELSVDDFARVHGLLEKRNVELPAADEE